MALLSDCRCVDRPRYLPHHLSPDTTRRCGTGRRVDAGVGCRLLGAGDVYRIISALQFVRRDQFPAAHRLDTDAQTAILLPQRGRLRIQLSRQYSCPHAAAGVAVGCSRHRSPHVDQTAQFTVTGLIVPAAVALYLYVPLRAFIMGPAAFCNYCPGNWRELPAF